MAASEQGAELMSKLCKVVVLIGLMLPLAAQARAEEGVVCLQKQLAALGFDPGKADGRPGPATRRALAAYEAEKGVLADRTLDPVSAIVFCRELGLRDPRMVQHWPAFGRRLRVEVAGYRDDDLRAWLLEEAGAALAKVEALFGVRLAAPVDIVIGSDAAEIAERARPYTGASAGAVGRFATRTCRDAPPDYGISVTHLPGVILFCHQPDAAFPGGFNARELRNQLGRMLAMEMIAQLTGDPANGSDDDYYRRTGPMWLVVGTMQLLQREVDGAITPLGRQKAAEKLRTEGVANPRQMEYYLSSLEDPEGIGRTGLLVTDDLTRDTGLAPIGAFYRALGTGQPVEDAFRAAFGKSLAEVYEGYP